MKYRKRFGRWGEAAVARAFRDRGFAVQTQEGMNRIPFSDVIITRKDGLRVDVQVKATARKRPEDAYQIDWGLLRKYLDVSKERNVRFVLAVANARKRAIFIFSDHHINGVVAAAERGIGDHYSRPGRLELDYEHASVLFDLTTAEIADGIRIAEDEGIDDDAAMDDLFSGQ